MSFTAVKKNWSHRFPCKTSSDLHKIISSSLPNCTEFQGKFTVTFAIIAHVDIIKYQKDTVIFLRECTDCLSFHPQCVCDHKTTRRGVNRGMEIRRSVPFFTKYVDPPIFLLKSEPTTTSEKQKCKGSKVNG